MSKITIMNMHNGMPNPDIDFHVRVDRASILGNPFFMVTEADRADSCVKHEIWLDAILDGELPDKCTKAKAAAVIAELKRIKALTLMYSQVWLYCWCVPKRCHAKTIRNVIECAHYDFLLK